MIRKRFVEATFAANNSNTTAGTTSTTEEEDGGGSISDDKDSIEDSVWTQMDRILCILECTISPFSGRWSKIIQTRQVILWRYRCAILCKQLVFWKRTYMTIPIDPDLGKGVYLSTSRIKFFILGGLGFESQLGNSDLKIGDGESKTGNGMGNPRWH